MSYTPKYTKFDNLADVLTVGIEETAQRMVAINPTWMIARRINPSGDSRETLEANGFIILEKSDELFYAVTPPDGWTKETSGYWTTVFDDQQRQRYTMFYKGAWYDTDAFLNISKVE